MRHGVAQWAAAMVSRLIHAHVWCAVAAENINQLLRTLKQDTVKVQMFALKGLKQLLAERSEWIHHYLLSDEARTLWVTPADTRARHDDPRAQHAACNVSLLHDVLR